MKLTNKEVKILIACLEDYKNVLDSNYSDDIDDNEKELLLRAKKWNKNKTQ